MFFIISEKNLGRLIAGLGLLLAGFCVYALLFENLPEETRSTCYKLLAGGGGMVVGGLAFIRFTAWKNRFIEKRLAEYAEKSKE